MADLSEKEAGYNSGSSDSESQQNQYVFERPAGLRGLYSHPLTQVFFVVYRGGYRELISLFVIGVYARLCLFHVSRFACMVLVYRV